jgi:ElaB/YqjD/DUF883 family membrane-anchored ribosome-binding protein
MKPISVRIRLSSNTLFKGVIMKTDQDFSAVPNSSLPTRGASGNSAHTLTNAAQDAAADAAEAAKRGLTKLVDRVEAVAHESVDSVGQLARKGTVLAQQGTEKAKSLMQRCNDATCAYVAEQPMKSILISAAAGAALTALLMSSTRRRY